MREELGQMMWVGFEGTVAPPELLAALQAGHVGGTILFKRNLAFTSAGSTSPPGPAGAWTGTASVGMDVVDIEALCALNRSLHAVSPAGIPAVTSVDQEGGVVQRVRAPATQWPPMMAFDRLGSPEDEAIARRAGRFMGTELRAMGFDIDFAPVLDVHTNPANPIIGDRAFGTDPDAVARRAIAFAHGLAEAGIWACGKHFPGHGDTLTDSHLELPWVTHDQARLEAVELVPFARAAAAGIPLMMTAHVMYPALDAAHPATLSEAILTGILRKRFGYQGLIISDDLDMKAISADRGADAAAVAAVQAGCDVLLCCRDPETQARVREALIKAWESDSTLRSRIGESVARIEAAKRELVALQTASHVIPRAEDIGGFEHRRLADKLAGR